MRPITALLTLAIAAPAIFLAQAASATVVTATYQGILVSTSYVVASDGGFHFVGRDSTDVSGVFGAANTSLNGQAFTLAFSYDLTQATNTAFETHSSSAEGGAQVGGGPFGSATLTIAGVSVSGVGNRYGFESVDSGHGYDRTDLFDQYTTGRGSTDDFQVSISVAGLGGAGASILTPGIYSFSPQTYYSYFFDADIDGTFDILGTGGRSPRDVYGNFAVQSLTITRFDDPPPVVDPPPMIDPPSAGGVPEPAVWAMLVLGFGGIGARLRGRLRPQAARAVL